MKKLEKLDIKGLKAVLHYESEKFIVCCHGLYSNKDSKKYIELAEMANRKGISCIRFDFRGCGESKGKFDDKIESRLNDLIKVVDFIYDKFDAKISLFGSSFGGMVAILYASLYTEYDIPLVTISTPFIKHVKECSKILIIHGIDDELVSVEEAKLLYKNAKEPKRLLFFKADHSFSNDNVRKKALEEAVKWLYSFLME